MPVTHGSAPESSDVTVAFDPSPPTLDQLTAANPAAGSVLSAALRRARTERRNPGTISAVFDNKLSDDDEVPLPRQAADDGKPLAVRRAG